MGGGGKRGGHVIEKRTKTNKRKGGGEGFKKILGLSKLIFLVILQFILLIITAVWNIKQTITRNCNIAVLSMNGVRLLSPALFALYNFSFFSLHCPLFSLCIFSKNGYLFIGYRQCAVKCTNVVTLEWKKLSIFLNLSVFRSFQ